MLEKEEAQKLREAKKNTQSHNTRSHGHGRSESISKKPVFLGRLFSSPLRRYIFHWVSTKRGRSIFYHKGLWTKSHVYAGQHMHTHTQSSSIVSMLGCSVTSPGCSISALRWKRGYSESKKTLNCLSKERKAYRKKYWECFYQRDDNTKDMCCR